MPTILENETLLYAQAFYAVNHINFLNPNAYKPERYVLKGHSIQKINERLNDTDAAASDGNLSAVLCMASAAHLEVSSLEYVTSSPLEIVTFGIYMDGHMTIFALALKFADIGNSESWFNELHHAHAWFAKDGCDERWLAGLSFQPPAARIALCVSIT